jgi:hypothetical protein
MQQGIIKLRTFWTPALPEHSPAHALASRPNPFSLLRRSRSSGSCLRCE